MTTDATSRTPSATEGREINRREFLNFVWLASLGFLMVNIGGVTYLFSLPRFQAGEFGGQFSLGRAREVLPPLGGDPINFPKGRFWIVRTKEGGVLALYKVCTHLGCLYNWQSQEKNIIVPVMAVNFSWMAPMFKGLHPAA